LLRILVTNHEFLCKVVICYVIIARHVAEEVNTKQAT
jgi:hypothetical protein